MAKLKYRSGSSVVTLLDTDRIDAMGGTIEGLPRLVRNGAVNSPWPYGVVYWNASADNSIFHLHGNIYFSTCADAWAKMVQIPGRPSGEYGLKVGMELGAQPVARFLPGIGFLTTNAVLSASNMNRLSARIGTDGNVYIGPCTERPQGDGAYNAFISVWYACVEDFGA